jgi:von Willebrand factor type A domain
MHRSRWFAAGVLACSGMVAAATAPVAGADTTPGCVVANNVVFVVDDSGSMAGTDPSTPPLRVQAMQLEIKRSSSDGKTFAAIEFGDTADVLFPPELVSANRTAMLNSLSAVQADNGSTDYNLAFDTANTTDPTAQARIFMTDGGHNVGDYNNTHLGGGKPKTYVIGFGDSGALPEDAARLQQIANDTGGQYFAQTSSAKLVSVMNNIDNLLNCQNAVSTVTINDVFTKVNQAKTHAVTVPKGNKAEDLVTSFNPGSNFAISQIVETLHGKVIGKSNVTVTAARKKKKTKVKKLTVTKQTGPTFINLHIAGLKAGAKLKFKLTAKTLGFSIDPANPAGAVTTQLTPKTS